MRMEGNARTWFTPRQRAELWERWKSGQCVADIARALERRNKSGVYRVLAINGGIAPSRRRRAPRALKLEERAPISAYPGDCAAAAPRPDWCTVCRPSRTAPRTGDPRALLARARVHVGKVEGCTRSRELEQGIANG